MTSIVSLPPGGATSVKAKAVAYSAGRVLRSLLALAGEQRPSTEHTLVNFVERKCLRKPLRAYVIDPVAVLMLLVQSGAVREGADLDEIKGTPASIQHFIRTALDATARAQLDQLPAVSRHQIAVEATYQTDPSKYVCQRAEAMTAVGGLLLHQTQALLENARPDHGFMEAVAAHPEVERRLLKYTGLGLLQRTRTYKASPQCGLKFVSERSSVYQLVSSLLTQAYVDVQISAAEVVEALRKTGYICKGEVDGRLEYNFNGLLLSPRWKAQEETLAKLFELPQLQRQTLQPQPELEALTMSGQQYAKWLREEKGEIRMRIPESKIGAIVGPRGGTIRLLQERCYLSRFDIKGNTITAKGNPENLHVAESAIGELLAKGYTALQYDDFMENVIRIPARKVENIKKPFGTLLVPFRRDLPTLPYLLEIKDSLRVQFHVLQNAERAHSKILKSHACRISIAGRSPDVKVAAEVVEAICSYGHHELTHPGFAHVSIEYDPWHLPAIEADLKHIENNFTVQLDLMSALIIGRARDVLRAKHCIEKTIARLEARQADAEQEQDEEKLFKPGFEMNLHMSRNQRRSCAGHHFGRRAGLSLLRRDAARIAAAKNATLRDRRGNELSWQRAQMARDKAEVCGIFI